MTIAVGMPPAVQAYVDRARELTGDASEVQAELDRSTEGADLASAFQHYEALELQLRREDGSVIPTEGIGITDTHILLERSRERDLMDDWSDVGDLLLEQTEADRELEESIEHDAAIIREWFGERDDDDDFREWAIGEVEETTFPRYQIHVELVDDASIP